MCVEFHGRSGDVLVDKICTRTRSAVINAKKFFLLRVVGQVPIYDPKRFRFSSAKGSATKFRSGHFLRPTQLLLRKEKISLPNGKSREVLVDFKHNLAQTVANFIANSNDILVIPNQSNLTSDQQSMEK